MDASVLLALLAVVVAVDTVALLTLLVLTVRWHRPRAGRQTDRHSGAIARSEPATGAVRPPELEGQDPLADAISAFLGRSDGIFRAGGPPVPAGVGPATRPVPAPVDSSDPEPAPPAILERTGSEVTWAPARPTRYVPSGPRPGAPNRLPGSLRARLSGASPSAQLHLTAPPPAGPGPAPASGPVSPPAPAAPAPQTASRLTVALVGRAATGDDPSAAVARLGPVIGGLLRERTRVDDHVVAEAPGRFIVVLPETTLPGAEALADRVAVTCEAWLAAELPALRLAVEVLPFRGFVPGPPPDRGRAEGPERRRPILQDA